MNSRLLACIAIVALVSYACEDKKEDAAGNDEPTPTAPTGDEPPGNAAARELGEQALADKGQTEPDEDMQDFCAEVFPVDEVAAVIGLEALRFEPYHGPTPPAGYAECTLLHGEPVPTEQVLLKVDCRSGSLDVERWRKQFRQLADTFDGEVTEIDGGLAFSMPRPQPSRQRFVVLDDPGCYVHVNTVELEADHTEALLGLAAERLALHGTP